MIYQKKRGFMHTLKNLEEYYTLDLQHWPLMVDHFNNLSLEMFLCKLEDLYMMNNNFDYFTFTIDPFIDNPHRGVNVKVYDEDNDLILLPLLVEDIKDIVLDAAVMPDSPWVFNEFLNIRRNNRFEQYREIGAAIEGFNLVVDVWERLSENGGKEVFKIRNKRFDDIILPEHIVSITQLSDPKLEQNLRNFVLKNCEVFMYKSQQLIMVLNALFEENDNLLQIIIRKDDESGDVSLSVICNEKISPDIKDSSKERILIELLDVCYIIVPDQETVISRKSRFDSFEAMTKTVSNFKYSEYLEQLVNNLKK